MKDLSEEKRKPGEKSKGVILTMINERLESALLWCKKHEVENRLKLYSQERKKKEEKKKSINKKDFKVK